MQNIFLILALLGKIWLVEQDFIKVDKKQAYETAQKEEVAKAKQPRFCFYDSKDREYTYLTIFDDFEGSRKETSTLLRSLLNFSVASLMEFQPQLSYRFTGRFGETPYVACQIFSVLPMDEDAFREKIRAIVLDQDETAYCWGVWKMVYGSELPKYVIGHFAADEKTLSSQLKAVKFDVNDWVRRKQESRAVLVPELSVLE